jgi:hypothetical protein
MLLVPWYDNYDSYSLLRTTIVCRPSDHHGRGDRRLEVPLFCHSPTFVLADETIWTWRLSC